MIRVAVVGAGAWGKNIVRTLHMMGALDSVVEARADLREGIEQTYADIPVMEDFRDALSSTAQAIAIATPAHTHYELAAAALEAGKDVFVEKPMTLSVRTSEELVRLAREKGRVLMTGHLLLYQPAVQYMRQAIQEGKIGRVLSIHQERLNLGRAIPVGNVLWSLGVHDIAIALYLLDESPTKVDYHGQFALGKPNEDDSYLHAEFPSGAQFHLHNSWLWPEMRRQTVVVGSEGMLLYEEKGQTVTWHRKRIGDDLQNIDEGSELAFQGDGQPLTLELQHFLDCCRTRQEPISSGASALEVIRTLESASPQSEAHA